MKRFALINTILVFASIIAISSCTPEESPIDEINNSPGPFSVTVKEVRNESATIEWTESIDTDGDKVTYSVFISGNELVNALDQRSYTFSNLSANTSYNGRVVAIDEKNASTSVNFTFKTETNGGGSAECTSDNSIDQNNVSCGRQPEANSYDDSNVNPNGLREIITNGIPTHDYNIQIPNIVSSLDNSQKTYYIDNTPAKANSTTNITQDNGRPLYRFGVAKNGVAIDPAPAEPFIFENPNTGEYNWDWVMEPNNNMSSVQLDCAIAHVQPDG